MTLDQCLERVETLRRELRAEHDPAGIDEFAAQHVVLGFAQLDEAVASFRLATLHHRRAIAVRLGAARW